jgi:3-carboxy-cis,cis-muconate cycloisomerase
LLVVQLGGASGNLSVLGGQAIAVMQALASDLGLACPAKPWHTERDGIVELANWLAMVSGLLGRIGGDLILMGRSEAGEARAGTGGGSSTMPQKSNPVLAETLVTLARFNAGLSGQAQQALLHQEERDGAAWTGEWLVLPQMLVATGAGLSHALDLIGTLEADPARMAAVIEIGGGAIQAESLAFALARHISLADAQQIVKQAARGTDGTLAERVAAICRGHGLPAIETGAVDNTDPAGELIERSLRERD